MPPERKKILLRLDPAVHDALARWAADELRSANAQIEFLLRQALRQSGRLPGDVGPIRPRGRPPADAAGGSSAASSDADPAVPAAGASDVTASPSDAAPAVPASDEAGST